MLKRLVLTICIELTRLASSGLAELSSVLETLYIKGDSEMYESIMGADDELISESELEW